MTTLYKVLDAQNNLRATFVFENDAKYFISHEAPGCHIQEQSVELAKKRRKNDSVHMAGATA